ncbi:MAG: preprotein translocase subunit YajC [Anaeromyxobacteraceae bacterium]
MHPALSAFLSQTAEAQPASPQSILNLLGLPLVLFGIFYFLVIRPQSKHARQHTTFVSSLKKGDEVATQGGIIGTVHAVEEKTVILDVGGGTKLKVLKPQIAGAWKDGMIVSDAPKAKAEDK